jgi:DNA-binding NarL/FixJ family response regulator
MESEHGELLDESRPAWRVLVVDDHPSFRRFARALLIAQDFDVVGEAADGAAALAQSEELTPEVVLLDIQLPDIDGFQVASRMLARNPCLAVVLVSSRDRTAYGDKVQTSGARGFIEKADLSGTTLRRLLE